MRAWLLLLIVLATFQTIVQVASTEDSIRKLRPELQQQQRKKDLIVFAGSSNLSPTSTADTTALTIKIRNPQLEQIFQENQENHLNRVNRVNRVNRENHKTLVLGKQVKSVNRNINNNKDKLYRNIREQDPFRNLTINMQNILENHLVNYHKHKYKKLRKERLERIVEQTPQQIHEHRNFLEYQRILQSIGDKSSIPTTAAATTTTTTTTITFKDFQNLPEREKRMQQTENSYFKQHLEQHRNRLYPRHQRNHRNYHTIHHPSHLHLQHIELENKSKHLAQEQQPTISPTRTEAEEFITNLQSSSARNDRLILSESRSDSNDKPSHQLHQPKDSHPSKYKHKHKPTSTPAVVTDDVRTAQATKQLNPAVRDEIKNGLLSLLKMDRPPEIDRSKIVIPEIMTKLYAQKMRQDWNYIVRSFTHKPSKIDERFPHHHRFRLYFDVSSIPAEEKLKAAELQLFREIIQHSILHPRQANRTRYQVLVYDILRLGIKAKRPPKFLLLDNKLVWLNSTEMVSLDVHHAVERWLSAPKNNHGLLVEVRTPRSLKPAQHHHVRLRRSTDEEDQMWRHKQPFLITYTDNGHHKSRSIRDVTTRSKRAGHTRKSKRRKNHDEICQRRPLYVDFSEVGWSDWIVAPPGYDAFYCQGKCPFPLPDHLNSTNHAVVQTIANDIHPGKVPHACCVPTQLEGHSFLYLNDENTVVLKNYEDMAVVGCGCR